jgi:hypothetical protein
MILVDSSALVEYYRPNGFPEAQAAVTEAIEADAAAINGIIQVEVLGFASGRDSFDDLLQDFKVSTGSLSRRSISTKLRRWDSP